MIRVMLKVKDRDKVSVLEKYGTIVFKSPILNWITIEVNKRHLPNIINDPNVISHEIEPEGRLMPV